MQIVQYNTRTQPLHVYNKIMPPPAIPATKRYILSCKRPMSSRGMMTAPAALFFVDVPEELLAPVPVGAVVTVPVPALPAWLRRLEQELLVDPL